MKSAGRNGGGAKDGTSGSGRRGGLRRPRKPPLRIMTTTLWEYPSQHYGNAIQGTKGYEGATPSWVVWQLLQRYTRERDVIVDPMVGGGTTIDVCRDLNREPRCFDLRPIRDDIQHADARELPIENESVDFFFVDPPYSTHIDYSDDPRCRGKLNAGGEDDGAAYYESMGIVIDEAHRVLKNRRYMGLYVSDSFKKGRPFMPIGFELFAMMRERFKPV
ncbi:MAG: DNA methyltransferase, partial [Planctomycetota bacterium]